MPRSRRPARASKGPPLGGGGRGAQPGATFCRSGQGNQAAHHRQRGARGARVPPQADEAGATMNEVVSAIQRVTDLMSQISAAEPRAKPGESQVGEAVTPAGSGDQQKRCPGGRNGLARTAPRRRRRSWSPRWMFSGWRSKGRWQTLGVTTDRAPRCLCSNDAVLGRPRFRMWRRRTSRPSLR